MSGVLIDALAENNIPILGGKRFITIWHHLKRYIRGNRIFLISVPLVGGTSSSNREKHGGGEKDAD